VVMAGYYRIGGHFLGRKCMAKRPGLLCSSTCMASGYGEILWHNSSGDFPLTSLTGSLQYLLQGFCASPIAWVVYGRLGRCHS
jgi:hypothetical protein